MRRKHDLLRRRIRFCCYTQDDIAEKLGLSHTAFVRRLNGLTPFSVGEAYAILGLLMEPISKLPEYFPMGEEIF